jgi:hypothetical protein
MGGGDSMADPSSNGHNENDETSPDNAGGDSERDPGCGASDKAATTTMKAIEMRDTVNSISDTMADDPEGSLVDV